MKKTLSILLALIIALSCCTVAAVGAAPAEEEKAPQYLLGDTDLDGEVSVLDATLIQRDLASLEAMDGLQKALGDIAGTGVDITCATAIQRHLAGFEDEYPIGETAGDENEGVIYQKDVLSYVPNSGEVITTPDKVLLSTAYPDVPFLTDDEMILTYFYSYGYQNEMDQLVVKQEGDFRAYQLPNGSSIIFDYEDKLLIFSDYSTTTTVKGCVPGSPYGATLPAETPLYKYRADVSKYFGGDPCMITFSYDEVPMLKNGNSYLIPLQTFVDFFLSPIKTFVQYNGKGLYTLMPVTSAINPDYWKQYYSDTDKVENVSAALAQVNYYELCNVLDARYGLRKAHDINDFDSYFKRRGLKEEFLSGNLQRIEDAQQLMGVQLFEDFHSGSNNTSPFFGGKQSEDATVQSPVFMNRRANFKAIEDKRTAVLGEKVAPYERRGDTVFITFDEFTFTGYSQYYQEGFEPSPDSGDTIELFAYALKRLQNEDSDAKNVVVDIACNGGGAIVACGYVIEALIGKCIICSTNPNTLALSQNVTKFDLNLDGTIDENDISMKKMGKNIAVVMSDSSFSCGNLLPCSLNALDDDVLLMGQQSGGGACGVGYITTALGSMIQISGETMMVTMKNGYIRDIDNGVAPEIPLTMNRIFDREYIANVVSEQFG